MENEKPKILEKIVRDAIIAGIISSIIFSFLLQPLISSFLIYIQTSGLKFYTDINDKIYAAAALGYRNDAERSIFSLIVGLLWAFTFSFFFFSLSTFVNPKLNKGISSRDKIRAFINRIFNNKYGVWVVRIIMMGLVVIYLIFSVRMNMSLVLIYGSTELNASFNQKLNALKPYMSQAEEEIFYSSWALMKNESDYNKINDNLEKVASDNKITLPRTLWPDVLWSVYAWP